jgi:putative spermidine/putrescine transport system ATP-binding protein
MTFLVLTGVQKRFGDVAAVHNFDLAAERGEFVSFLGPSGCGKTTTLRMIAGFEQPTAGTITIDGNDITRKPPNQRNVGMVFQAYALFPNMTVADNVGFGMKVHGKPAADIRKRVGELLELINLPDRGGRYPYQLSGGQQQRVALARALVFEPQLVLMDEPLGALDKQLREHMQLEIKALHRRLGINVVYVTHDQSEALTMSDRVAVFTDGMIQQLAPVEEMYERPANRFVAGFIGDSTVLEGTVRAADSERCGIVLPDGRVITGLNVNGAEVGARVVAGIRPERIVLHLQPPGERGNVLLARVSGVIYFGDHLRLLCSAGEGQAEATVKLPLSGGPAPQAGQDVWLEFPPELTRIYR